MSTKLSSRLGKLERKMPKELPKVRSITVDPRQGETMESVYLREFGEPYKPPDTPTLGPNLIVRTIVYPKNVG